MEGEQGRPWQVPSQGLQGLPVKSRACPWEVGGAKNRAFVQGVCLMGRWPGEGVSALGRAVRQRGAPQGPQRSALTLG